jgi:hypothetical protein
LEIPKSQWQKDNMRFLVSGSTGMIGSAVCLWLEQQGHTVSRLIRPETKSEKGIVWDVERQRVPLSEIEGHDVVIHLGGAGVADQRWTPEYKRKIYFSRVKSTILLAESLAKLRQPPKLFLSGSAVGFYGNHSGGEQIDEDAGAGQGFLPKVCQTWEQAAQLAGQSGIRVVLMRMGLVRDARAGALFMMLPAFRLGLGGPLGNGEQVMSWIALKEIPLIIDFLSRQEGISGPVNFVAPQAVSNREFARSLGKALCRPAVLPMPKPVVSLVFGEMGRELLLSGARVKPRRLMDLGYQFTYPELATTLADLLK